MSDRVLYMEDDAAQARLVQKCLERCGYVVDLAGDGAAGLAACEANRYDAVIVDQTMPGLSGLEVIRTMTARGKYPPIVMVTGTGNERIAVEAMKLGVSDYLVKDLEGGFINVLPLVVGRAIEQRRLLREKQRMEKELAQAQRMRSDRATGGGHCPRNQHPDPIHRRQRPLPARRLRRRRRTARLLRPVVAGRPQRYAQRRSAGGDGERSSAPPTSATWPAKSPRRFNNRWRGWSTWRASSGP